jgi:long-chain acyl-CoA synthetase
MDNPWHRLVAFLQTGSQPKDATWSEETAMATVAAAERLLQSDARADREGSIWHAYLDRTRDHRFLTGLPDREWHRRWAETTFSAIDRSGFTFRTLWEQRVQAHPDRWLFQDAGDGGAGRWSYAQIARRLKSIAAVFLDAARAAGRDASEAPRVAIWAENSLSGACCDLACLFYDILVTPLNVHFGTEDLHWVLEQLDIDVAVTDSEERAQILREAQQARGRPRKIFRLEAEADARGDGDESLDAACAGLTGEGIADRLARRPRRGLHEVATVMFTSGSTGRPKGVAFSIYNLVTKRFARAAALPKVGDQEILLCYLPLFHTFGRYLEMLGMIFWGGQYVFAGNPSAETLLAQLREIRPTGLIGIPLRWQQIWDHCLDKLGQGGAPEEDEASFREIVGDRLRWGLSAAGYLDPRAFRFFQRHGVELCSGFGMTEATGGITMTPPGEYQDNSVGIPLPGVRIRFTGEGELEIGGPYIARYLEDLQREGTQDVSRPYGPGTGDEPEASDASRDGQGDAGAGESAAAATAASAGAFWLATGDLFKVHADGNLEIVDRVKDIYKNSKGQTIAPRRVEQLFTDVPGVVRTFLAGDGRAYNILLIVPDWDDAVLKASPSAENTREYFHQLVTTANRDLAPYERVVNFALLDRDFSLERGELTPKGSYRRKAIEANFQGVIDELYQSAHITLNWGEWKIRVPRWFFRDLGVLEDDIRTTDTGLVSRRLQRTLPLQTVAGSDRVQTGSLEYGCQGRRFDLGTLVRQPLLWAGNATLLAFSPVKTGWDTPFEGFHEQVFLPQQRKEEPQATEAPPLENRTLAAAHLLIHEALFGPRENALVAVAELGKRLSVAGDRLGTLIRRRLEALARHPDFEVRCRAYRILVLDAPVLDYNRYLPAFLESGLPFLSDESISAIAGTHLEPRRLQAFRQRLQNYRQQLAWPAPAATRRIFEDLFKLLANYGRYHPEYYAPVREELVSWILHEADPELSGCAQREFHELADWFETKLQAEIPDTEPSLWEGKIAFQDGLTESEQARIEKVLVGTTFLTESIMLIFEHETFNVQDIGPGGIWISRILSMHEYTRYRVSINTLSGKHFDLLLIIRLDFDQQWTLQTIYWLIAIRGYPYGTPVVPRFGCARPELGAMSLSYFGDLTVWEKIRAFSSQRGPGQSLPTRRDWRKLLVRAMTAILTAWRNSGGRILPGFITPTNVCVVEPDFREGDHVQALTGWRPYEGPLSLVRPLIRNFYLQTASHYPWCRDELQLDWVCEACVEAMGTAPATAFLSELLAELRATPQPQLGADLPEVIERYLRHLQERYHRPLALQCAIDRYQEWRRVNAQASTTARRQTIAEMFRLYRLDRYEEIARYTLYRHTYFAQASPAVQDIFDRLLAKLFRQPKRRAAQMVELSDMQDALKDPADLLAFRRLAFPRSEPAQVLEVLQIGDREKGRVIVRSEIADRSGHAYAVREPADPAEVGQLYRLFRLAGFPKTISEADRFFIATNAQEQVVGGICYQPFPERVVHLDGIAVARSLYGQGIGSALLEDFCARMAEEGHVAVKTHFYLRHFYQRRGFRTDQRWGGLVRFLVK